VSPRARGLELLRAPPGLRSALPRLLLTVLATLFVANYPFRSLPQRLKRIPKLFETRDPSRIEAAGFWFDPDYARFLEAVRESTPQNATVAVIAPITIDLYVYEAAYGLVPRRVVDESQLTQANFVAVYGRPLPKGLPPGVLIPGGVLIRR
jgi:hypothetical protein